MKIIVLGSGLLGVASSYYLSAQGHEVVVIDRQSASAMETSFANGGQISVSHAQPWASPDTLSKVFSWLGKDDAPLWFRLRADWRQWWWGMQFLRQCTTKKMNENLEQILHLGTYSRSLLQALRAKHHLQYDQQTKGILHFYTNAKEYEEAVEPTMLMHLLGCERRFVQKNEIAVIEPAMQSCLDQIKGATYTAADESGDAHQFTKQLTEICQAQGVQFLFNHTILKLEERFGYPAHARKISGVHVINEQGVLQILNADAFVVALGSYSPLLLKDLGVYLPIYPAKGYSITLPVLDEAKAYQVSLTDDEYKLVFSRLGNRLRIAGTAEFNGYNTTIEYHRIRAIVNRVRDLFPDMADYEKVQCWTGLRPATPSNVPLIGRCQQLEDEMGFDNLYLNTGHGTLGFTHACGSGKILTDVIENKDIEIAFNLYGQST